MRIIKGNNAIGSKANAAATDTTSSWSVVSLLKGILLKLLASINVVITGSSVAHDAPSTANPVLTGFVAESTIPTAVADGDLSQAAGTLYGAAFVNLRTVAGGEIGLVNTNQQVVSWKNSAGVEPSVGSYPNVDSTAANSLSTPAVAAVCFAYNELTAKVERLRNNIEGTLLTSAARTASANTADFTIYNGSMLALFLDATLVTGTTPTLDVTVKVKDTPSGKYFVIGTFTQVTAVTNQALFIGGGADVEFATRTYRIEYAITGTTPSFTFSVGYAITVS